MDEYTGAERSPEERAARRRIAAIVTVSVLAAALLAAGVWALVRERPNEDAERRPDPIEHAQPTTPREASSTAGASETADATSSVPATGTAATPGQEATGAAGGPGVRKAARVAYRLNGALHVAAEDGSSPVRVAASPSGVFSLSPDGRSLAFVDGATRELQIADVATGAVAKAGGAEQTSPVWSPTSEWVFFTAATTGAAATSSIHRTDVLRVARTGGAPAVVASGLVVAAASDGRTLVVADVDDPAKGSYQIKVVRDGRDSVRLSVPGPVTGLATDGARAYVAISHVGDASQQAQDGIWVVPLDGSARTRLASPPSTTRPVETRSLMLSPDGSWLAYACMGDDGYSRAAIVRTAGGVPSELARRRDAYPITWSADGSRVFFIEGNAWQGEGTALVNARPDGSAREVVVEGAGL